MATHRRAITFLDELGGAQVLRRAHKLFYDEIFKHPWFKQIFPQDSQPRLEIQQTAFMTQSFGGPKNYSGRTPVSAHVHIMITDEMYDKRARILSRAIQAVGVSDEHRERWLEIDGAFRTRLVKKTRDECSPRWNNDPILDIPNPRPLTPS